MNNDKMQDLATRLKQRYGIAYTVGYNTTVHYGLDKHPLIAEAIAALSTHGQESEAQAIRKAFICKSCGGVYADQPVTHCDCLPDKNEFTEAYICGAPLSAADSVAVQEPEGFKLVPIGATDEIIENMCHAYFAYRDNLQSKFGRDAASSMYFYMQEVYKSITASPTLDKEAK